MSVPMVRVGDVLTQVTRSEPVKSSKNYQMLGVRSFGRGPFIAAELLGSATKYASLRRVEENDLVYPKLMAWEGAFAVVPSAMSGYFVSPEFCTFTALETELWPGYMRHLFAWDGFTRRLAGSATGTNVRRRRLHPSQLLAADMPLPDITEQRAIAARLDKAVGIEAQSRQVVNGPDPMLALAYGVSNAWHFEISKYRDLRSMATVSRGKALTLNTESSVTAIGQASVRWKLLPALFKGVDEQWAESVPIAARSRAGELLVNSTGDGTIGRAALVEPTTSGYLIDSHILRVQTHTAADAEMLLLYLWSSAGRLAIERLKGSTTTKQTELGIARLSALPIPEFSPPQRTRYVHELQELFNASAQHDALRARSRQLLRALPQAARNAEFSRLMA